MRLKDKLGNRSNATAEAEFHGATGFLVGELGRGIPTIIDMVTLTRLDCAVASAGLMRIALAEAVHHARHRRFGELLIEQPLMTGRFPTWRSMRSPPRRLSFPKSPRSTTAPPTTRRGPLRPADDAGGQVLGVKVAPALVAGAMECLGGNGYVEDGRLPRLYREAPVNAIWEGAGNVMCLDVMRVLRKTSEPLEAVLANVEDAIGSTAKSTLNVLRAATAVALADEGSARILTEQLAMTVAAAALRRRFPSVVADAFLETRLGKPWRTTYGMLDSRFDAKAFINYVCPSL
jgi:putative acyl-CoA dehydrogenase